MWNDPDIGNYTDDFLGTDTLNQAVFAYDDNFDDFWKHKSPAFFTLLLQGPQAYIPGVTFIDLNSNGEFDDGDIQIDSAKVFERTGKWRFLPGAKNLSLTSSAFSYVPHFIDFPVPTLYELWLFMNGEYLYPINPCNFQYGIVVGGIDCNQVNPKFIFSGDQVKYVGWLNTFASDARTFGSIGRFVLEKNKPVEIFLSYTAAQGETNLESIETGKVILKKNSGVYDLSFPGSYIYFPPISIFARTTENRIDLI